MAEWNIDATVGGLRSEDVEDRNWERASPRRIREADWRRFEGYLAEILHALGMPLDTPGTTTTPSRYLFLNFARARGNGQIS